MNTSAGIGKSIISPNTVIEVRSIGGHDRLFVEEHWGLVHQYRGLPANHAPAELDDESLIDLSAYRYKDQILTAVKVMWMELQEKCGLQDVVTESKKLYEPGTTGNYHENLT